jgi:hypothetical protein
MCHVSGCWQGKVSPAPPDAARDDVLYCATSPGLDRASDGQPRVIEGLSDAAYMTMLHQEAQEQQARLLVADDPRGKRRTA